jgi:hypothetical protein
MRFNQAYGKEVIMIKKCFVSLAVISILAIACVFQANAANFQLGDANVLIGGSLRYDIGWKRSDLGSTPVTPAGQVSEKTTFFNEVPIDNRLFLGVAYDKIKSFLDIAIKGNDPGSNAITNRQAYFTYDMGGGNTILFGQTYSILSAGAPKYQMLNADNILRGFGNLAHLRIEQIQFSHKGGPMLYQFSVETTRSAMPSTSALMTNHTEEKSFPAVVAAITYKNNGFTLTPSGYFQSYKLRGNQNGAKDINVTSWAAALNGEYATRVVTISMEGWYGSNLSTLGPSLGNNDNRPSAKRTTVMGVPYVTSDGNIRDARDMGGWIQLSFPVKPIIINVGAGYQREEVPDMGPTYESSIETKAVFTNFRYPIYKGFFMQPEIVWFDYGHDAQKQLSASYAYGDNKLGSDVFAGIHFQYDF